MSRALSASRRTDLSLLILRLVIGASMLVLHGWGKISGGAETWRAVGAHMRNLGVTFAPTFWGFMAASAESIGSALLILGVLFRPAAAALAFTMLVAALRHLNLPPDNPSGGWKGASHALELLGVYVALLLAGPGRYRLPIGRG